MAEALLGAFVLGVALGGWLMCGLADDAWKLTERAERQRRHGPVQGASE